MRLSCQVDQDQQILLLSVLSYLGQQFLQLFDNSVSHFFSWIALSIWFDNFHTVFRTIRFRFDDFQSVFINFEFRIINRRTILPVIGNFHDEIRSFYVTVTTSCFMLPWVFPLQNNLQRINRLPLFETGLLSIGTSFIPCTFWHHYIPQISRNKCCRSDYRSSATNQVKQNCQYRNNDQYVDQSSKRISNKTNQPSYYQ